MSQLIQLSLRALVSEPNDPQRGKRGKNFNSRQVVVSNGFGAGRGEKAVHSDVRVERRGCGKLLSLW